MLLLCIILLIRLACWEEKSLFYLGIVLIALSFLRTFIEKEPHVFPEFTDTPYTIEVKQTTWKVDGNQLRFEGTVIESNIRQKIMVNYTIKTEGEKNQLEKPYKMVVSNGTFRFPKKATNANVFDYERYLRHQNIKQVFYAEDMSETTSHLSVYHRKHILDSLRMKSLMYSEKVFSPHTSLYIQALVFADRNALQDDVLQSFKNLGLMHLLSISGLHISFLLGGLNKALLKARLTQESSMLLQLVFLVIYAVFTGLGTSVYRASVQHGAKNLYGLKKQVLPTLDCWSIALITLLLLRPSAVLTSSFQLSFSLSFLIILLSNQVFFKKLSVLKQYAVLNGVLFTASIPILSYHFFEFSFGALVFNSIYIPFISLFLLPILVVLLLSSPIFYSTSLFSLIDQLASEMIQLMEAMTHSIEGIVSLVFVSGRLSEFIMVSWAVTLLFFLLTLEKKINWQSVLFYLCLFSILALSNRINPFGEIVMIDVGQGDAVLIKEPFNKEVTLIDTGGVASWKELEEWEKKQYPYALGSHVLAPLMKSMGISKIDTVLITHLHYDHYGELATLAEHISIVEVAGTRDTLLHPSFQEKLLMMDNEEVRFKIIEMSTESRYTDRLTVLKDSLNDKDNINNQSIVLLGKYGKLVWMFTGDIEAERENQLLEEYPNLQMDVLKVAHHGSSSSSTVNFIEQTKPNYALISVGETNRYNHPNDEVLLRLKANQVNVLRTDYHGSIHYKFSDNRLLDDWINKNGQNFWTNSSRGDNE